MNQYARGVRKRLGVHRSARALGVSIQEREKLVIKIARTITKLQRERKRIRARDKAIGKEMRAQKRGLRIALQAFTDLLPDTPEEKG